MNLIEDITFYNYNWNCVGLSSEFDVKMDGTGLTLRRRHCDQYCQINSDNIGRNANKFPQNPTIWKMNFVEDMTVLKGDEKKMKFHSDPGIK